MDLKRQNDIHAPATSELSKEEMKWISGGGKRDGTIVIKGTDIHIDSSSETSVWLRVSPTYAGGNW